MRIRRRRVPFPVISHKVEHDVAFELCGVTACPGVVRGDAADAVERSLQTLGETDEAVALDGVLSRGDCGRAAPLDGLGARGSCRQRVEDGTPGVGRGEVRGVVEHVESDPGRTGDELGLVVAAEVCSPAGD